MAHEYTVDGKTIRLTPDTNFVAVRFREPAPRSLRAELAGRARVERFSRRTELPKEKFTVFSIAPITRPDEQRYQSAVSSFTSQKEVARVSPVFKVGDIHVLATDRLMIGLKAGTSGAVDLLQSKGCEILEKDGDEYLVRLPETADPFEVAAELVDDDSVEYAEPDFVSLGKRLARGGLAPTLAGGDPFQERQYAIEITQALEAWQLQTGIPRITIAILDEGVETDHEDLAGAIIGSYDAVDNDTFQEPKPWDAHGTACAGLAAAIHGNDKGIRGIGGGCALLAVRIAYSEFKDGPWIARNFWIRRAIDWSWRNSAAILSNSWGGGAPSNAISNAFRRARTQGRNGKGCVVVVAAGNASMQVDFPGNLDGILTVSASNEFDEPKTKTSHDGEFWWGSNFGRAVDVAAPGVHNYTTDISGQDGYGSGNYIPDFNGTSSACPLVAGAVGLVLSAHEELTEAEVRQIIRDTADKVGGVDYTNGHNDQMGYGRLNVLKAVEKARSMADKTK